MMAPLPPDDLTRQRVVRIENQLLVLSHLTKSALSLLKRLSAGEEIPVEQIEAIEQALEKLTAQRPI